MFQYATARAVALRNNAHLHVDVRSYQDVKRWRDYQLWRFDLPVAARLSVTGILRGTIAKSFRGIGSMERPNTFVRMGLGVYPEVFDLRNGVTLQGQFQSHRYFSDYEKIIRKEFDLERFLTPRDGQALRRLAEGYPLVSLHVRRGDYVGSSSFSLERIDDYYEKAVETVANRVPGARFIIFSDDPEWCKEWWIKTKYEMAVFSSRCFCRNLLSDLAAMAHCSHNIIANSTFSWWAAWLNRSPGKLVVMPSRWLNPWSTNECGLDVPGWLQIVW
jgi:hypothetical protein